MRSSARWQRTVPRASPWFVVTRDTLRPSLTFRAIFFSFKRLYARERLAARKKAPKCVRSLVPCGGYDGRLLGQCLLHGRRPGQQVEAALVGHVLHLAPLPVRVQVRVRTLLATKYISVTIHGYTFVLPLTSCFWTDH